MLCLLRFCDRWVPWSFHDCFILKFVTSSTRFTNVICLPIILSIGCIFFVLISVILGPSKQEWSPRRFVCSIVPLDHEALFDRMLASPFSSLMFSQLGISLLISLRPDTIQICLITPVWTFVFCYMHPLTHCSKLGLRWGPQRYWRTTQSWFSWILMVALSFSTTEICLAPSHCRICRGTLYLFSFSMLALTCSLYKLVLSVVESPKLVPFFFPSSMHLLLRSPSVFDNDTIDTSPFDLCDSIFLSVASCTESTDGAMLVEVRHQLHWHFKLKLSASSSKTI